MASNDDEALHEFVTARYPELRRSAFLMCGDWALAAEQTQKSLARLVAQSRRGRVHDPDAYVYSHLLTSFRSRKPRREHLFMAAAPTPDATPAPDAAVAATASAADPAQTILVLDALHKLSTRCRAVLILRHWEGFAVDETADMLGLSDDRVDAYDAAGLAALDYLLHAAAEREPAAAR